MFKIIANVLRNPLRSVNRLFRKSIEDKNDKIESSITGSIETSATEMIYEQTEDNLIKTNEDSIESAETNSLRNDENPSEHSYAELKSEIIQLKSEIEKKNNEILILNEAYSKAMNRLNYRESEMENSGDKLDKLKKAILKELSTTIRIIKQFSKNKRMIKFHKKATEEWCEQKDQHQIEIEKQLMDLADQPIERMSRPLEGCKIGLRHTKHRTIRLFYLFKENEFKFLGIISSKDFHKNKIFENKHIEKFSSRATKWEE